MIYLDNAATTKVHPSVLDAMIPFLSDQYGNPSTNYDLGIKSKEAIESARHIIAKSINAEDDEIYFTSGGTEADNTVIKSLPSFNMGVVTTPIEHKAILNSIDKNSTEFIRIDRHGRIELDSLDDICLFNRLVSVMYANNETGTMQPIKDIGLYIDQFADLSLTIFHTDAVQAYCHVPIDVKDEHIDMLSASAHKFHGPKGIGFLYINKEINMNPFITGGGQERGFRSGTENVASIVGMAKAVEIAMASMETNIQLITAKRDFFESRIINTISGVTINGGNMRLPGHSNITIKGIKAEEILELLNEAQIYASSGSACSSKDSEPSYVLKAMGLSDEQANSSLRFTIGEETSLNDLSYVADVLRRSVALLRNKKC